MSYRTTEFNRLNEEFSTAATLILDNDNENSYQHLSYVIDCFNAIIVYAEVDYDKKKKSTKEHIVNQIEANRDILRRCFDKLNIPATLPGKLLSTIHLVERQNRNNSKSNNNTNKHTKMSQTTAEFLKIASSLINYKFEGDPLKLQSFLEDIELVEQCAEENNKKLCLTFIKRCVSGRALEYLPDDIKEIKHITDALKKTIKPETSAVVEGKLLALKIHNNDLTKFTEEAEKLAEAFRRSLVVEGTSKPQAEQMTIKKTIELCRKSTKDKVTKSVVASTPCTQPAQVLALFVTQTDIARREKQEEDAAQLLRQQNKNSNRGGVNGNFRGRGKGRGNFNNFGNSSRGNGQYQGNRQQNDNKSNFRGNGRGNGRGNYQNRQNRTNEHTIRFVSGNSMSPSNGQMMYPQQQMFHPQQQQQQNQTFHIPFQ